MAIHFPVILNYQVATRKTGKEKSLIVEHEATEQAPVAFHEGLNMYCLFQCFRVY